MEGGDECATPLTALGPPRSGRILLVSFAEDLQVTGATHVSLGLR